MGLAWNPPGAGGLLGKTRETAGILGAGWRTRVSCPLTCAPSVKDHDMSTQTNGTTNSKSHQNSALISSECVTGTDVFNHKGDKLGTIDAMLINKQSGQVRYAVMSFGGFLGIGERFHQLPWNGLAYDPDKKGYVVNISRENLKGAPSLSKDELANFDYDRQSASIDSHYASLEGFYSPQQQALRSSNGARAGDASAPAMQGDHRGI